MPATTLPTDLPTDVNFTGSFPPDPTTALGRVMMRICIGTDTRQELEDLLLEEVTQDAALREADITAESVPDVVEWLIQDHNTQVHFPSQTAHGLITAFDELTESGIVFGFGEARDVQESLTAISHAANTLAQQGFPIHGYCFSTIADVERMILQQQLSVAFGVFDETGAGAVQIGERIAQAFTANDLHVAWNGTEDERIQVIGGYAVPYVDPTDEEDIDFD
ncbi:DUF6891 domain-containing protein [Flexivirga sp. B27]